MPFPTTITIYYELIGAPDADGWQRILTFYLLRGRIVAERRGTFNAKGYIENLRKRSNVDAVLPYAQIPEKARAGFDRERKALLDAFAEEQRQEEEHRIALAEKTQPR